MKNLLRILIHKFRQPKSSIAFSANLSLSCMISENVKILDHTRLGDCSISRYSYVGEKCTFERTKIGSFCSIGPEVMCGMGTHPTNLFTTYPGFFSNSSSGAKSLNVDGEVLEHLNVEIGSDVWIGARVIIIGGVKIGHGAIVGAGAVVTKDVPPYAIVGGIPAKLIRYRFDEATVNALLEVQWWNADVQQLKKAAKISLQPLKFLNKLIDMENEDQHKK